MSKAVPDYIPTGTEPLLNHFRNGPRAEIKRTQAEPEYTISGVQADIDYKNESSSLLIKYVENKY